MSQQAILTTATDYDELIWKNAISQSIKCVRYVNISQTQTNFIWK